MKKLRYLAFTLSLVIAADAVHAANYSSGGGSGKESPTSSEGLTDEESRASLSGFESLASHLTTREEFPTRRVLESRIEKVRHGSARPNTDLEDPAIQEWYRLIEDLYNRVGAGEVVGSDRDLIIALQQKMIAILDALPNVAQASTAENPGNAYLTPRLKDAIRGELFLREEPRTYEEWAAAARGRFLRTEGEKLVVNPDHQDQRVAFFKKILGTSEQARDNLSNSVEGLTDFASDRQINRLLCFHLARAAGYTADHFINTLIKEMKFCIKGPNEIVFAFNRVLIADVMPLLLEAKFLQDAQVLNGYFENLRELFAEEKRIFPASDGIYTELQRAYNSLQLHIIGLRITTTILPALESELTGNNDVLRAQEAEQQRLLEEQQEAQLSCMDGQPAAKASLVYLDRYVAAKTKELQMLSLTYGTKLSPDRITALLFTVNGDMSRVSTQFRETVDRFLETFSPGQRMDQSVYVSAKGEIASIFDGARSQLVTAVRERYKVDREVLISAVDGARAAKMQGLAVVAERDLRPAAAFSAALTGLSHEQQVARYLSDLLPDQQAAILSTLERESRNLSLSDLSADKQDELTGEFSAKAQQTRDMATAGLDSREQDAYATIISDLIKGKQKELKKKLQRIGAINTLMINAKFKEALQNIKPESYSKVADLLRGVVTGADIADIDRARLNTGSEALFQKLADIAARI